MEGFFKKREVKGRLLKRTSGGIKKGGIVEIEKYEKKESDVNIASHIVWDSAQKNIGCVVLLSNDTDLKTPLRIARKNFGKRIGIIAPLKAMVHQELKVVSQFRKKNYPPKFKTMPTSRKNWFDNKAEPLVMVAATGKIFSFPQKSPILRLVPVLDKV